MFRGRKYNKYVPVQAAVDDILPPGQNVLGDFQSLCNTFSRFAREEGPERGIFEKTCQVLFGLNFAPPVQGWGLAEPFLQPAEEVQAYKVWEEQSVLKLQRLPLELSQAIYNFSRVHENSAFGQQGLPIPQMKKRKQYIGDSALFLSFCVSQERPWARQEDISQCWIDFVTTRSEGEKNERRSALGSFVLQKRQGISRCESENVRERVSVASCVLCKLVFLL